MSDSPHPTAPREELPPASAAEGFDADLDAFENADDEAYDDAGPETFDDADDESDFAFTPVEVRYRYDGWLPEKQVEFIERLADCGCVDEAADAVGMSRVSAYALRRRPDAQAFRLAWDAAMDTAVARLRDSAMSRAIKGVKVPIFHAGVEVGERRHFDERLTMFLLRYRDPVRYGKWLDTMDARQHPEGPVLLFVYRLGRLLRAAWGAFEAALDGRPPPEPEHEITERPPDPSQR
jgi:hypothetical protein